jgi:ABC-type Fe3+-siderophore transport system permease subunit
VRWARIGLSVALLVHGALTAASLRADGLLSPFPPFERLLTLQIFSDLVCASMMLLLLIAAELRRQGRSLRPVPLLLVGITLSGSFAPMLFLLLDRGFLPGLLGPRSSPAGGEPQAP